MTFRAPRPIGSRMTITCQPNGFLIVRDHENSLGYWTVDSTSFLAGDKFPVFMVDRYAACSRYQIRIQEGK